MNMKRILAPMIILLLVLGWGNIIGGNARKYKSYTEHMKNAKALEAKEIYIDAVEQYKKALEFARNKLPVQEAMLDDYLKLKKYKDFEKQGNAILESYNYPKNVAKKMTDYYIDRKQTVNALKLVNAYLERNADDEEFLALQGKLRGSYTEVYFGSDDIKIIHEEISFMDHVRDPVWEEDDRRNEEYIKIHGEPVYDDEEGE